MQARHWLWTRLHETTTLQLGQGRLVSTVKPQGVGRLRAHHTEEMCQCHLLTSTHRCQCC